MGLASLFFFFFFEEEHEQEDGMELRGEVRKEGTGWMK